MSILCIGQAVYDLTFPIENTLIENQKYRIHNRHACMGAPAANAAYLTSSWRTGTSLIARVGDDLFGQEIIGTLKTGGVDTSLIHIEKDQPSSISCIAVNKLNGHRTILNAPMIENPFSIKWPKKAPNVILVDGHELEAALASLKKYPEALSIMDAGTFKPELLELIGSVDYLVCSEDFAFQYTGIQLQPEKDVEVAEVFAKMKEINSNHLVITIGDKGCLYEKNGEIRHYPAFSVKPIDTTGAGDIFHGAFAYGLEKNYPLEQIIELASAASALSVQRIGGQTSIPTLKNVQKFIS